MGLLDFFGGSPTPQQGGGMLGLLSPDDRFMAAMQALSHMGAAMAQPGQSRGQALANAGAGLSSGLQSGMQSAITQGLLGQKLKEAQQQAEWKKTLADAFGGNSSSTPAPMGGMSGLWDPNNPKSPALQAAMSSPDVQAARAAGSGGPSDVLPGRTSTLNDPKVQGAIMGLYGPTGLAALRAEDKAPTVTDAYDPQGRKTKKYWDSTAKQWVDLGGSEVDATKPIFNPQTGRYEYAPGVVDAEAGKAGSLETAKERAGLPFVGAKAGAAAAATSPYDIAKAWAIPRVLPPGANILDLSGARGGPPGMGGQQSGPRTIVKAPQEWGTDPSNPGLQVSTITGERKAIPPGVTDDKEAAKNAIISTDRAISTAEELLKHPGRQAATGKSFLLGYVPGTDAYDFGAKLETLKSQLFLPEVEKMKGMGALSNAEGQKLTAAVQALDPKMTEEGLYKAIQDVAGQLRVGRERMMAKTQTGYLPSPSALPGNAGDLSKLSDDEVLKRLGLR